MTGLLWLDTVVIETRAEQWYDSFASPFKWISCLLALAFVGAAFHTQTRAIFFGPFIALVEVSAPLTGVMAACLLSCFGIALLLTAVEGYVDSYTSDYKVVSGDGQTYSEPSFRSKPCGTPRALGKNLDCVGSYSCETTDTVSGRWVKVERKNPSPMQCWVNYRHVQFQHGWVRSHLPFLGSTAEEQQEAKAAGIIGFTRTVSDARSANDRAKLNELGLEASAERPALPEADANALEQAMSETRFATLLHDAKATGNATLLREAFALTFPKDKSAALSLLDGWYLERRGELKARLEVMKPSYEPSEAIALALSTVPLLPGRIGEGNRPVATSSVECTGLVERLKADLLEASKRSPYLALEGLERLEGEGKAFLDACNAETTLAPAKKAVRSAYLAAVSSRLQRLARNLDAALPLACEADRVAGNELHVPAPNLQSISKNIETTVLARTKLAFTAPPNKPPLGLWYATPSFDTWRASLEETFGKSASMGKATVTVNDCGKSASITGDVTVGGKPVGTIRATLRRTGNDFGFAEAPELSK